jgi:hypothetical protein
MSNKSGVSDQIISLPQGGGALQGIGEKFSPDLYTGTANFTIPIAVPAGRNWFQPKLDLVYSSGNGNSFFGQGWNLSIPAVSRKTSKAIPLYQDADIFILSGTEDLIAVSAPVNGVTRYRPRTEGLFARIERITNITNQDDYWRVWSKDGLISVYGTPGTLGNADLAAIGRNQWDKFAWKLSSTQDPFGNQIAYLYEADVSGMPPHSASQTRLKQIAYVFIDNGGMPKPLITVSLEYESRPDAFSDYRPGFEVRTASRCKAITVRTHFDQVPLMHTYRFTYDN